MQSYDLTVDKFLDHAAKWHGDRQIVEADAGRTMASIGYAGLTSTAALAVATFFAGFCVLGIQTGINVVGALVYPTSLRANGSGWQLGVGRIGSIVGPLVGALFVGMAVEKLYIWSALPFAVGAVVCFAIYRLNEQRLAKHPELR